MSTTTTERRDWLVWAGMSAVAIAAAVSSYAGLYGLATLTGWDKHLAVLYPVAIDAYALTATRVWLARSTRNTHARAFARWNAIGAIALSVVGNSIYHYMCPNGLDAPHRAVPWQLVVAVAAVPPIVLGLVIHMAHIRTRPEARTGEELTGAEATADEPRTGLVAEPRTDAGDDLIGARTGVAYGPVEQPRTEAYGLDLYGAYGVERTGETPRAELVASAYGQVNACSTRTREVVTATITDPYCDAEETRTEEERTDETAATEVRTETARTESDADQQIRTEARVKERTGDLDQTRMDRTAVVEELLKALRTDPEFRPNYAELQERTGYKRSWLEKRWREAREQYAAEQAA